MAHGVALSVAPSRHVASSDVAAPDVEFSEFVSVHQRRLLGFAHLISGNPSDAEDLLQTALAKTYLKWERDQRRRVRHPRLRPPDHRQRTPQLVAARLQTPRVRHQ
ncbi:sigma factor [Microlunatus sp. Y2014]|uniref:sigma factor n=1 Tax=Microlunatus sp. Y2014 TaxID=3418488 RepID=UPI003DA77A4C